MNSTNNTAAGSLITWKRAKPAGRGRRLAGVVFRSARNIFAALGLCFVYLLVLAYFQYQDQAAQFEVQCAVSRCM